MSLRLPLVQNVWRRARETLVRFPLALLSAFAAAGLTVYLIEGPERDWGPRLVVTLLLGLVWFSTSVITAERRGIPRRRRWLADLVIALGLALLYRASLGWPDRLAFLRFFQLVVVAHLAVAVLPYLAPGGLRGFWQFNRIMLLRFVAATVYAGVLGVGLAIALGAVDKLFGVHIAGERYAQLMALLAFGFHPWFFLAGVPRDYAALDELEDYPAVIKVFTQYALIPLVAIYLLILTAYLGKVVITRTWPSGWIGYLVSSVSLTGMVALLLVHPIRQREDSRWVRQYSRWWFVALLPSLGMLLLAVAKRIGQYGFTEPRYFLLVLTLWQLGLALYYLWRGSENIKLIPFSLGVVAALSALGPWGAYAISRRSQQARFHTIVTSNRMGTVGRVSRPEGVVSFEDRRELSAILRYFDETYGVRGVSRLLGVPADTLQAWKKSGRGQSDDPAAEVALARVGVIYVSRREQGQASGWFRGHYNPTQSLVVSGFDVMREMAYPTLGWIGTPHDSVQLTRIADTIQVWHSGLVALRLDLAAAIRSALPEDTLTRRGSGPLAAPIVVAGEGNGIRVRWSLNQVAGRLVRGRLTLQTANGPVLVAGLAP